MKNIASSLFFFVTIFIILMGVDAQAAKKSEKNNAMQVHTLTVDKTTCPADFPDGFTWPADPTHLWQISGGIKSPTLNIPGKIDTAAQRQHGWSMFAGVTKPATNKSGAPPVFHTWYTVEEAFDPVDGNVGCGDRINAIRLTLPTQLVMELNKPLKKILQTNSVELSPRFDANPAQFDLPLDQTNNDHEGVVAFSHVAFNKELYEHIRSNKLYSKASLNSLIEPSVVRKHIPEPSARSISLKFSWWPVAPDRLTPVPVWDFDPRFPGDAKNPPSSWKRVVLVDPKGGLPVPDTISLGGFTHSKPAVVGLERFYAVELTAADAEAAMADFRLKNASKEILGRKLKKGDFLVLTAMHIATREFEPWVFLTYWWTDKPNVGPLASDMPASLTGVWRNFVMDVSYNINNPKTSEGKAPIAYSPWLELFQLGGVRSQCMACHARAAYGPGVRAAFNPVDMATDDLNGFEATPENTSDPNFKPGTLSLQRIWTIFTRAQ